jgi:hypothetical protein
VIKSIRIRWVWHVACIWERRGARRGLVVKPGGRNHLEDPGVDGRMILKWFFENWDGDMDWMDLAQNRDRWRICVNAVMNHRVPQNAEDFLTS